MFKKLFTTIFQHALFSGMLKQMDRLAPNGPNLVRVLTYHQFEDDAAFEQQVRYLKEHMYVASVPELMEAFQGRHALPPRSVVITFDDAYRSFAEHAWPILRRYQLPAALFVPTAYPDNPNLVFWWDKLEHAFAQTKLRDPLLTPLGSLPLSTRAQRVRAFKRLRAYVKTRPHLQTLDLVDQICMQLNVQAPPNKVLGWDALRRLAAEGVTLGAHTRTHPLLSRVPLKEARDEALGSLDDLKRKIGRVEPIFAYPGGYFTPEVVEALKRGGMDYAFTTLRGSNDLSNVDPLLLRRNDIGRQASRPVLQARLLQAAMGAYG